MTVPAGAPELPAGDGHVELRDVSFAYDGEPVLSEIDLDVPAGRTIAIVGATGSGKTTLVSLLPRLYDPTRAACWIDGADVSEVQLQSLRSQVGLVSDDPFLFTRHDRENIAYARPDASAGGRSRTPPGAPTSTTSSPDSRTATTRSSASAA